MKAAATTAAKRKRHSENLPKDKQVAVRKNFLESPHSDPNDYEGVIGDSNLMSINFLDRGKRAAAAVCRISAPSDGGAWYGTGFLVGPRLLLTNHHVLANHDEASQAEAEFGLKPYSADEMRSRHIQTTIAAIEKETDLDFSAIRPFDAQGSLESTRRTRWITDIGDVII